MKSILILFLTVIAAVVNSSHSACVSNKSGSDVPACLNGVGCCASLSYLVGELNSCLNVSTATNKVIILVKSDVELYDTLFITNFCNVSRGFELVGSNAHPTIKCCTFDAGFHFRDIQDLHIAHLKLSKCGLVQHHDSVSHSQNSVTFEFYATLYVVHCYNVLVNNVTISNGRGSGLVLLNTHGDVTIINSTFENNGLVGGYLQGSGGLHIELGNHVADPSQIENQTLGKYIIQGCYFNKNNASSQFTSKAKATFNGSLNSSMGKGGGLFISICDNNNHHQVKISDCMFNQNSALYGGGIFIQFYNSPKYNTIIIENSQFLKNKCQLAGGGAGAGYAVYKDSTSGISMAAYNNVTFSDCLFEENISTGSGGGLHLFSTKATNLSITTNTITIHNCTLNRNKAYIASALVLAPNTHDKGLLPKPVLSWCTFSSNYIGNENVVSSSIFNASLNGLAAVFVSDFQIKVKGNTSFFNNNGTALWLTSAEVEIFPGASINFTKNSGSYGGAIGLYGESVIYIEGKTRLYFINNTAKLRGGAISVESNDFLHKYLFSHNCFIQYKANLSKRDTVFHFDNNKAFSGNGHILFSASIYPCFQTFDKESPLNIFKSIGTVTGPQAMAAHLDNAVTTLPRNFSLKLPDSKANLEVQPGITFKVDLLATDEFSQPTRVTYQAYITDEMKKSDDLAVKPSYAYVSQNTISLNYSTMTGANKILTLESEMASLKMHIVLMGCPPGFINSDGSCVCGATNFNGISSCVSHQAHIIQGFWAGVCTQNRFCTSYCPAGFCNYGNHRTSSDSKLLLLPSNIQNLDSYVCGPNRTGILCGKCNDGYSTNYHSYYYGCKPNKLCNVGIVFFLISELLPLTVLYTVIMVFNISFTSGEISGFIFFAQIADSLSISASDSIRFPPVIWYFTQAHQFIYRMFNFDFFSIEALSFCLWKDATALDAMIMKYVTILYAMGLIFITVLLMKSTRFKRFCVCLRPRALRSAAIHGLTTFIIICYSQCARVSFQIISPAYLYGNGSKKLYAVVQRSGELKPFDETHRKYAIPALFFFFTLVVLPLVWLLLYPLLFKTLEKCQLSESKLAAFLSKLFPMELLDSFQSCFKPNRRYFAGLYFLYRIMTLLAYSATSTLTQFYTLLTLGMILVITLHSIAQPYKVLWHNILDAFFFANIMAVNALTLYNFHVLAVGNNMSSRNMIITLSIQLVLMYLPLFYAVMLVTRKIYVNVKRRYSNSNLDTLSFEDSTSLPSLRDSVSYHQEF